MDVPMDAVEYLARSDYRLDVLEALRISPRTREDIRSRTEASRVTVGRILGDLEERGWIERHGVEYVATPRGRFVSREFTRMMRNLETHADLPPVLDWLPDGAPTFEMRHLDDATVVLADEGDLLAPIHRALELIARSDELIAVGNGASSEFIEAIRDTTGHGQSHTLLGPPAMVEALRSDPDRRAAMRSILASPRATLLRYEGESDLPVFQIGDGLVALCSGDHRAMIETDDDVVYEWATSYFESLRNRATVVPRDAFAETVIHPVDEAIVE